MKDDLGGRMKMYEGVETTRFMPLLPVCVRLDGKCFSKFTRKMTRPYDEGMVKCMTQTTRQLVQETNAVIGYTQSDEITLVFYSDNPKSEIFFGGKKQKIVSVLSSMTTGFFNEAKLDWLPGYEDRWAFFDCRAWQVPTLEEAANAILWRELDASKNSVSMLAQHHFSHKSLQGLNSKEMQEKLMTEKSVNWNNQPDFFKRGVYFKRVERARLLTEEERLRIPEFHRPPADHEVTRTDVVELSLPKLASIDNRVGVLFRNEEPVLKES